MKHCSVLRGADTLLKYNGLVDPATMLRERPEVPTIRLSRTLFSAVALLAVATMSGCRESCCDVIIPPINGYAPPNAAPRASQIEFPDPTLTAGRSLTVSGIESLFLDDDPLTLTATSSDTTVVAVSMVRIDYSFSLTFDALSPGTAEVSIVATEPMGDGSQDDQQPQGRFVSRTVNVTVVPGT